MTEESHVGTELIRSAPTRYGVVDYFANDTGAASRSLVTYGEWAANEISFLAQFIQPGAVVLDVGAFIGTHTLAFARLVGPEGQVIAFEAQPETFALLSRNVAANNHVNVRLEKMALGDISGFIDIPLLDPARPESFGSISLISTALSGQAGVRKARLGTIDGLGLPACNLIKVDAEGMEGAILGGAAETIRRFWPVIYAECNSIADGLLTLDQLKRLDYVVRMHVVDAFAENNFLGAREDIFGGAREAALIGMHRSQAEQFGAITPRPCELLLCVETADDLALGLLNKPQYVPEVLVHCAAAESGGVAWIDGFNAIKIAREKAEHEADWAKTTLAEERTLRVETEAQFAWVRDAILAERSRIDQTAEALVTGLKETHERLDIEIGWARDAIVAERERLDHIQDALASAIRDVHERLDTELAGTNGKINEERDLSQRALGDAMDDLRFRIAQTDRRLEQHNADMANQSALFESAMREARFARDLADAAALQANAAKHAKERAVAMSEEATRHAESLAARLRNTEAILHHTETTLNAVHCSTSWRLTLPLRWLIQWLRR